MAAHRARMRADGYREVRMWVPDVRREAFAEAARGACQAMNVADAGDDIARVLAETSWADAKRDAEW